MQLRVIVFVDRFRYFPVQVCGRDVSSGGGLANISVVGSINRSRVSVVFIKIVDFALLISLFPYFLLTTPVTTVVMKKNAEHVK